MRPQLSNVTSHQSARQQRGGSKLNFRKITRRDIGQILDILTRYDRGGRTCDYTIGGLLMWVDYFSYSFAVVADTLFVKGVSEEDGISPAFAVPVGAMPLRDAVGLLREYCAADHTRLRFSAVPEAQVERLRSVGEVTADELTDWSDYLYRIDDLATMAGKKYNKKRNHINRFIADNPAWSVKELTADLLPEVRDFYVRLHPAADKPATADFERTQVMKVLDRYADYPFEGAVLRAGEHGIAAFAIGEVLGDTVFEHIEKMDHEIAGAGEMICREFAAMMKSRHPALLYVNREEDAGDPGLRYAKQSLHPTALLRKFDCLM